MTRRTRVLIQVMHEHGCLWHRATEATSPPLYPCTNRTAAAQPRTQRPHRPSLPLRLLPPCTSPLPYLPSQPRAPVPAPHLRQVCVGVQVHEHVVAGLHGLAEEGLVEQLRKLHMHLVLSQPVPEAAASNMCANVGV